MIEDRAEMLRKLMAIEARLLHIDHLHARGEPIDTGAFCELREALNLVTDLIAELSHGTAVDKWID